MTKVRKVKYGVAAVFAVLASISMECSAQSFPAGPPAANVNVVNTPLPVTVTNPITAPVPVRNVDAAAGEGARQILQIQQFLTFGNATGACSSAPVATVPAGKRLVITYLSASAFLPVPLVSVGVRNRSISNFEYVVVPTGFSAPGGAGTFSAAGQQMHVHTDSDIEVCVQATSANNGVASIAVTGYYVDKQ